MNVKETLADKLKNKQQVKQIRENLNLNKDEKIVINNQSKVEKIIKFIINFIKFIFKAIFFILIGILVTIGVTVLANENIRTVFFTNIHIFN